MLSFYELCEAMQNHNEDVSNNNLDDTLVNNVQKDLEFWQQLAAMANSNPELLSGILKVPAETVRGWYNEIQSAINQSDALAMDAKKSIMVTTGL